MKLAYFSPLLPHRSGISDYSEELLPYLARAAEITLFVDGFQPSNHAVTSRFEICDYQKQPDLLKLLESFDGLRLTSQLIVETDHLRHETWT